MNSFTLTIVRHAESLGNIGIYYEDKYHKDDPPLSEKGLQQAEKLSFSSRLSQTHKIYSSPLTRAVQTIYPTAEKYSLSINILFELAELNTDMTFLDKNKISSDFPLTVISDALNRNADISDPDAAAIYNRALRIINYIKSVANENEDILLVTHGSFFAYLMRAALGLGADEAFSWQIDNTGISRIIFRNAKPVKLSFVNDTSHLHL